MASFLKKTTFAKPEATASTDKPKLGATTASGPKLGGGLNKSPLKTGGLGKTTGKSLLKKKAEPQELDLESEVVEETTLEQPVKPATKPKLGAKKSLISKKEQAPAEEVKEEISKEEQAILDNQEDMMLESMQGANEEDVIKFQEEEAPVEVEIEKEEKVEPVVEEKKTTKKKTTRKSSKAKKEEDKTEQQVLKAIAVDETKRVPLEEIDAIMRPIVAPTTERWEQEKKDVLEALNAIKVEQDMNMAQVKSCLSELDELKFEILPKQHDAETMYDGTKQNYDTVKAVAIANGSGSNAEARKAEGILACQNFVTPSGAIVDLHQYMLLIEERYKFYEKIADGVNFKKYSLVNYNNAIKAEKEGK